MEIQAKKVLLQNTEGEIVVPVIDPNEVGSGGGWSPSIFQPFWSDHKLNRVDMLRGNTFSWQSGNVYIACYNKLLEEWTDKNADVTLNIDKIGNIVVAKNGVATGFSSGNYLQKAITLGNTKEDVFPIITEFTTGNDVFTAQQILVSDSLAFSIFITNNKLAISLGSNKTTYNITNQSKGVTELQVNTNYRAILDYDGTKYTLTLINLDSGDLTPSTELIIESDRLITTEVSKIVVGVTLDKQAPFLGSIRVSRLRIGTSYHAQTKCVSSNGFIMVDENHEQDVNNKYKRTGVAWYYIFDEVGKKFKLPRTKYGFVSTRDNVGEPVLTNLATGNNATDTQMYLYFYVGEFAQTALEENAGLNVELFNEKADVDLDNLSEEGKNKLGVKTSLITKSNLMKANGKKVQFLCSEVAPVTVKTIDGTTKTVSYIPELDLSDSGNGDRRIALGEDGNSKEGIFDDSTLTVSTDGWVSGFGSFAGGNGFYRSITYPTTKEEIFPITLEFKTNSLPTDNRTLAGTGDQYIWAVTLNPTGNLILYLGATGNTTWGIANGVTSTDVIELNVPYLVTIDYDGTTYTLKVRNMAQEGATDVTFVTVTSTTLIAGTSATRWGTSSRSNYFNGSILGQSIKVGTIIDNSDFLKQSVLGVATTTDDGITNITNNYQVETTNPLQEVTVHTKESYAKVAEDLPTNLDLIPFTFVDLDYNSYVTVSANTSYTLTKDVMVNTNSISTFTITKDGATYTVYGTWLPVRAGTTFKSSVAGKYYSFEGY